MQLPHLLAILALASTAVSTPIPAPRNGLIARLSTQYLIANMG